MTVYYVQPCYRLVYYPTVEDCSSASRDEFCAGPPLALARSWYGPEIQYYGRSGDTCYTYWPRYSIISPFPFTVYCPGESVLNAGRCELNYEVQPMFWQALTFEEAGLIFGAVALLLAVAWGVRQLRKALS